VNRHSVQLTGKEQYLLSLSKAKVQKCGEDTVEESLYHGRRLQTSLATAPGGGMLKEINKTTQWCKSSNATVKRHDELASETNQNSNDTDMAWPPSLTSRDQAVEHCAGCRMTWDGMRKE
jgi:hypothetical protein